MLKDTKTTKITQTIFTKFFFAILVIIAGFLVFGNYKLMKAEKKLSLKLQEAQTNFKDISKEKELTQGKILQSQNYDYLEQVAREELNFKKPGEQVVAFPEQKEFQETETSQKIKDLWQKFMEMRKK
ncbi:MAG: septum formation initiator family protein [bacterium]|nr:septum formation initiator family protein [bacterium]